MDKTSSLEGLRLTALKSKGYTAEQIAALAEAVEELLVPLQEHAESGHAPATAEENIIVSIKRNGVAVPPTDKIVNIIVPVKMSELENDGSFVTEQQVDEKVEGAGYLRHLVVEELPDPADAAERTIYYVRVNNSEAGNQYKEYQLINGALELVGGNDANLDGYATEESVAKADDALINSIFNTLEASEEKYVGTGNLATFWGLVKSLLTAHDESINDLVARVELLELVLTSDVTGNSYYVTFDSLDGVSVTGVWNTQDGRIEF